MNSGGKEALSVHITRPFNFLFIVQETFLTQARYEKETKGILGGISFDERRFALTSILMGVAAIESMVNCLYSEASMRSLAEVPDKFFSREQDGRKNKEFKELSLEDRLFYIIPISLISVDTNSPVFDRHSQEWQELQEVIQIRNKAVHSQNLHKTVMLYTNGQSHFVNQEFKENRWPITGLPRDIAELSFVNAKKCFEVIDWIRSYYRKILDPEFKRRSEMWSEKDEGLRSFFESEELIKLPR